jgi:DNA-binding MarR family transcriptional regulator
VTILENQPDTQLTIEEVRLALSELFGAERRLRAREQQQSRDLTNSQLRALMVLDKVEEVTAGELAKSADLNPASVTAMLDHLESKGIVERKRGISDRRVCMVSLTAAGRAVVEERRATWHALWEERFGGFSADELHAALQVMRTMIEVIDLL